MSADTIRQAKLLETSLTDAGGAAAAALELQHQGEVFAGALTDKGFPSEAMSALGTGNVAGLLLNHYFLGDIEKDERAAYQDRSTDFMQRVAMRACGLMAHHTPSYTGTPAENRIIIEQDYSGSISSLVRNVRKNGAQRIFRTGLVNVQKAGFGVEEVPIAVIGAGAAGVLTARALIELGFRSVQVFDKTGKAGGIWERDDVRNGSKNNPFDIHYDGTILGAATKIQEPQGSGQTIQRFIHTIAEGRASYPPGRPLPILKRSVTGIEPGDLEHVVHMKGDQETLRETFPIVVYAPGLGQPLPLSHEGHLTTAATRSQGGVRWQQQLSSEKLRALEGKRVVCIGLGNSTAEVVHQLQTYTDQTGRMIDYRIVTHYPSPMIHEPKQSFGDYGRLYRDITKPELTSLAGDLTHINTMLHRARTEGKIISGARSWHVDGNKIIIEDRDGISSVVPMDRLYTLTGYRQDPKELDKMGISCIDDYYGGGAYDYDGEVQARPGEVGRERVHPGYFAIGPPLKNRHNPNAIVIPGIQGQLNNLMPSVVIRAAEYALANPDKIAELRQARKDQAPQLEATVNTPFTPYAGIAALTESLLRQYNSDGFRLTATLYDPDQQAGNLGADLRRRIRRALPPEADGRYDTKS